MAETFGNCGRTECRYNFNGKCGDKENYDICLIVVKEVLGARYEDFLKWEKEELGKGTRKAGA